MTRMLGLAMFGVIVFGASAAASWLLRIQDLPEGEESQVPSEAVMPLETAPAETTSESTDSDSGVLPVAVRPRNMSVEELLRFGMGLNAREEAVIKREQALKQQESRLKLVFADIDGEQKEIDGLRELVRDELETARALLARIDEARNALVTKRDEVEEEINEIKQSQIEIDEQHEDNIKRLSEWMMSMEPEKAAEVLREMANDGKTDMAVRILANFEEREAAKVLSALDDAKLVQEFVEQFRNLKRPEKKKDRR
ncbi:hypothetical protein Mal4_46040 [Maioricimonas rarisocia]|uniref:Magnesium transporter MgtE intracellular domain-containing protein n=1 Tax=Maioricimonas rarisocia TaxID=2528026 RepID=A0A517ZCM8_9PLAN|nr:hypothetical protein [Maioricimonas rarisocia]QDU40248.1 hypothetical protein Mal4_46040 [Maioricimonas rarisocia]